MSQKYKPLKSRKENNNAPVILLWKTVDFILAGLTVYFIWWLLGFLIFCSKFLQGVYNGIAIKKKK